MTALQEHFMMHDNAHITDPGALGRVRAIVGGGECKVDDKLLSLLPKVEIISVCGVGYDGVDVEAAKRRGIVVTHTPDVLNDDVADMAIGLMLSISRKMPQADRFVRNNDWVDGPYPLTKKMTGARLRPWPDVPWTTCSATLQASPCPRRCLSAGQPRHDEGPHPACASAGGGDGRERLWQDHARRGSG
ncbi:MAG: hypothetical protein EBV21_11425 [Betaproteobacteria bacterium]|nr:hypothetical protein [Betaproteobacteria bacterium]